MHTNNYYKMPDNKQTCRKYKERHVPPTGKKCRRMEKQPEQPTENKLLRNAADSQVTHLDGGQSLSRQQLQILTQLERVAKRLDQVEDKVTEATSRTVTTCTKASP